MNFERLLEAHRHGGERGLMEDDIHAFRSEGSRHRVGNVTFDEVDVAFDVREVPDRPRGEVVENSNLPAFLEKAGGQVGTDKAGSPGDETSRHRGLQRAGAAQKTLSAQPARLETLRRLYGTCGQTTAPGGEERRRVKSSSRYRPRERYGWPGAAHAIKPSLTPAGFRPAARSA